MLEAVATTSDKVTIRATIRKIGVYLDNDSLIGLAKGSVSRRDRVITAFHRGADLMFSPINAAEIIGPECQSSLDSVRAFLDAIGPNWFPVEGADVITVLDYEARGASRDDACMSSWFLNQFFAGRNIQLHGEQRLELVQPDFFGLGFVLDWLVPQRDDIRRRLARFDQQLEDSLRKLRRAYEGDPHGFDQHLPKQTFDPGRPATLAFYGLLRSLILEAKAYKFKKGDAADLCHAVVASAFANVATLDKQWKRRVASLPTPNGLARLYYQPELDQLTADLEMMASR
jgi:hypothetical protein